MGTFVPGQVVKCPKCGANFDLKLSNYIPETDSAKCPQGHVFSVTEHLKKVREPTLKEKFTGRVLDGYVEASRVRTLEKFVTPQEPMSRVEELGRFMLKASDVGDWETFNEAKEERAQLIRKMEEEAHETTFSTESPKGVVTKEEIPTFTPAFLSEVKKAADTQAVQSYWEWIIEPKPDGVSVRLRGVEQPHEFFPYEIIEKMEFDVTTGVYQVR